MTLERVNEIFIDVADVSCAYPDEKDDKTLHVLFKSGAALVFSGEDARALSRRFDPEPGWREDV